jgi:LysR family transcriptional regulator for bpeEF and oprC
MQTNDASKATIGSAVENPFDNLFPFIVTANARSFSAAARRLGVNPSSISRSISRLEAKVGVKLLHRTSRSVALTREGAAFYDQCVDMLARIDSARSVLAASKEVPSGLLRISAPVALANAVLVARFGGFLEEFPALRLRASITDRLVDLVQENVDVAVRLGPLPDSSLIAKKVGSSRFVTVASPRYFAQRPVPVDFDDLARHRSLKFLMGSGTERPWRYRETSGRSREVDVPGHLVLDNGAALAQAAVAGIGIAYLPDYLAREEIAKGGLREIFAGCGDKAADIFCVYPGTRYPSVGVTAFCEFVEDALRGA